MTDMTVEIMVEVLTTLAIATNEVKGGRFSELLSCIFTLFIDKLFRKVSEEVDGKTRHRGQLGEVGQIDARRGTGGIRGAAEDDTQR